MKKFTDSMGWEILAEHIYSDKAVSGKSIAPRVEFNKLMEVVKSGKAPFQYLIVNSTSRVARNLRDALKICAQFKFYGINVHYVSQGIDTAQETYETLMMAHGLVDALYIKGISKETHKAIEGQVLKGYSGGGRHYGYNSRPVYGDGIDQDGNRVRIAREYVIDPEEAKTIIRIFTYFGIKGKSVKWIVNLLNKELKETGEPKSPGGTEWCVSTIIGSKRAFRGILNNEMFIGKYIWNKTTTKINPETDGKRMVVNDPGTWAVFENQDIRIVSDELWAAAKKRQKEIKKLAQGGFNKTKILYSEHLLTKLAKCGTCGGSFGIVSGGPHKKYGCSTNWNKGKYVCPNNTKIKGRAFEEAIVLTLCRELLKKDPLALLTSEIHVSLDEIVRETVKGRAKESIQEELNAAQQELENVHNFIKKGTNTETAESLLLGAEARQRDLKNELMLFEVGNLEDLKLTEAITEKDLENYFAMVVEALTNPATTRETLHAIVDKIVVHCNNEAYVDIEIHEELKKTISYVLDLIGKRDTRIQMQKGTFQHLYTSRVFTCRIVLRPGAEVFSGAENVLMTVGGC